jgi:hypothetical protein
VKGFQQALNLLLPSEIFFDEPTSEKLSEDKSNIIDIMESGNPQMLSDGSSNDLNKGAELHADSSGECKGTLFEPKIKFVPVRVTSALFPTIQRPVLAKFVAENEIYRQCPSSSSQDKSAQHDISLVNYLQSDEVNKQTFSSTSSTLSSSNTASNDITSLSERSQLLIDVISDAFLSIDQR